MKIKIVIHLIYELTIKNFTELELKFRQKSIKFAFLILQKLTSVCFNIITTGLKFIR